MPPLEEIWKTTWQFVLIPFGVSTAIFFIVIRLLPSRGAGLAGLLACGAAFYCANRFAEEPLVEYPLQSDRPLTAPDLGQAAYDAALKNPTAIRVRPLYWLVWTAALAGLLGFLTRWPKLPLVAKWALRIIAVAFAARLAALPMANWVWPALAIVMLLEWVLIETAGEGYPSLALPVSIAIAFFSAGMVIHHAHWTSPGNFAFLLGAAWLGIALVAWLRNADGGGAAPIAAVLLPSLLLITWHYQFTAARVPKTAYILPALSPLLLAVPLFFRAVGGTSPKVIRIGVWLMLLANAVAVGLAMRYEDLAIE